MVARVGSDLFGPATITNFEVVNAAAASFTLAVPSQITAGAAFTNVSSALKSNGSIIANNLWPWAPLGTEAPQFGNFPEAIRTVGWDRTWGTWLLGV